MYVVNNWDDFKLITDNKVFGNVSEFNNSKVILKGKGNIIYVDGDVKISDSTIVFHGDDSLLYLSESKKKYLLNVSMYNGNVVYLGGDNYFNKNVTIITSESKNVFIGSNSLLSYGITIRNSDAHLIFDIASKKRINFSRSIYIGDGVWIGQNCTILKGNIIGSGSIIGSDSVISNKKISSHSIWAGNPAKEVKKGVVWNGTCVHNWTPQDTEKNKEWNSTELFEFDNETLDVDFFEKNLNSFSSPSDKLQFIRSFFINKKNRMYIK